MERVDRQRDARRTTGARWRVRPSRLWHRSRAVLPGVTLAIAACASDAMQTVSVEPTASGAPVVFAVRDGQLFYGLSVLTCDDRVMWTLASEGHGGLVHRITYGVAPDGFVSEAGPTPLGPGCYDVVVSGPARARFEIGAGGRLVVDSAAS